MKDLGRKKSEIQQNDFGKDENYKYKYMQFKHIIWDYNGTLLNDVQFCVAIINEMLDARDLGQITIEKYRELFDFPVKDYYERAGFSFKNESFEKVGTEFIDKYNGISNKIELHAGIADLLKEISNKGIKQSVLSARKKEQLLEELTALKIHPYFEYIYGLDDHYAGGKSEIGKELIKKIDIPGKEILMIGDTSHDYEVAKMLGINIIALSYGHHPLEKLKGRGMPVLHSVKEVQEYIFS